MRIVTVSLYQFGVVVPFLFFTTSARELEKRHQACPTALCWFRQGCVSVTGGFQSSSSCPSPPVPVITGSFCFGFPYPLELAMKLEKGFCAWQIPCSSELQRLSLGTKWWDTANRIKAKHTTGNKLCYRLTAQIMRWTWLSWHAPDEPGMDHPPREAEGKYSVGGNLIEGGSVWGNWLISSQQLGWVKLIPWLTAPALQGWKAVIALGSPVLDPHPAKDIGGLKWLKGKWPAEKAKQPQTIKGPKPALFLTAFPEG